MTTIRRLSLALLAGALLLLASMLSYVPSAAYGTGGDDTPLPTQQVIVFAPLTSTPFYAALRDSVTAYGCTSPQAWRLRYGSAYPAVMIVQLAAADGAPTWDVAAKPWSFRDVGGYVRLLCPALRAVTR